MELIRKITYAGHSKMLVIPKAWLESVKNRTGKDVRLVKLHIDGKITIEPYFEKEQ